MVANPQSRMPINRADSEIERIWTGPYLRNGYFMPDGSLDPIFVERDRVERLVRAMCHGQPPLTSSQVRRFFGHCRQIETRLKAGGQGWSSLRADFHKLDIAAADAAFKKPTPKIPMLFHDFIRLNVAAVKTERDFLRGFLPHFEAVVGFGTSHFDSSRR